MHLLRPTQTRTRSAAGFPPTRGQTRAIPSKRAQARATSALSLLAGLSVALVVGAACGSRGPLDDTPIGALDAGADTLAADMDGAAEIPDATADVRQAGIVQCGACLVNQCSDDVLGCVQSAGCRATLQCVLQQCLAGAGGLDLSCMTKCGSSDPAGALKVLQIVQCVIKDCGPECTSLLGALLGGAGGGGGGGGRRDEGRLPPIIKAFSAWPEICPPEAD